MKFNKKLTTAALLLTGFYSLSASGFSVVPETETTPETDPIVEEELVEALSGSYFDPVTQELVFNEDSVEFSKHCKFSEVFFNDSDGSLDLVYNGFEAAAGYADGPLFDYKTCMFKVSVQVPAGWRVEVASQAGINIAHAGSGFVSFAHTLAGTERQALFKEFGGADEPPAGNFVFTQQLDVVGSSECGEDVSFKTVASIMVKGFSGISYANGFSGAMSGETSAWKYFWNWHPC